MGQSTSKASPSDAAAVETSSHGTVRGVLLSDVQTGKAKTQRFTGVPYAQPPVGPLRWRRPQRLAANFQYHDNDRHYRNLGNVCPQPLTYFANAGCEVPPQPEAYKKSEDCLQLNIWVPANEDGTRREGLLPVLFFIHGGWLQIGNPHLDVNKDPSDLIASAGVDCVIVAPGYRLNAFGFLAHDALRDEDEDGLTGNYGFLDQRLALEWTRDNIASFGGDPNNITVGGLSAGAHSAHSQLLHEYDLCQADTAYEPIIKRIFLQSNAVAWPPKRVDETADQFEELCSALEIPSDLSATDKIDRLRKVGDVQLAAVVTNLKMHTFRATRDDRPKSFVKSSWTASMADGRFGRWCEERGIALLVGEVSHEEKVYEVVNSPHDRDSLVVQLENYYPAQLVQAVLPLYGIEPTKASRPAPKQQRATNDEDGAESAAPADGEIENLYSIFGVDRKASKADIRTAYLALVRQHHPDKAQTSDSTLLSAEAESSSALIRQLNTAYAILSDDLTRQAYDRALEQQISQAEAAKQRAKDAQVRVSQTLDLDSFQAVRPQGGAAVGEDSDSDSDDDDNDVDVTFVHPCRCGHDYRISPAQISQGIELVHCGGCSEVVRVTWSDEPEDVDGEDVDGVTAMLRRARLDGRTRPTDAAGWARVFGEISADLQVYLTSRTLIEDLQRGGLPAHAVLRYRCEFRAPIFDTFAPTEMGVSHSFDDPVWWFALCTGGWEEQDLKRLRRWLQPYRSFLHGPAPGESVNEWRERMATMWYGQEYDVDTVGEARWIRTLCADATIKVDREDSRWQDKEHLIQALRRAREDVVASSQ